ncbi:acid protease [Epithele typhae]|uniref:acid protease n=1 Tax=Epithele typhae TaxID=378194 RepID=UPI0020080778|nr:acid protease [Epithele typhae]KAH9926246.1 acid protease [Epithele typhae]
MFHTPLALLALALAASASPVLQVRDNLVRLPMAKRVNLTGSGSLLDHDQLRAQYLRDQANALLDGVPLSILSDVAATNKVVDYVVNVRVGSPATTYSLLVDTGSSNTWVGAGKAYVPTSSSMKTGDRVSVTYGSGSFSGSEFIDAVSFGIDLTIPKQSIGVASSSTGFGGVDGIIGIGPVDLTLNTLSPHSRSTIPTVTDNLFAQGTISQNLVAVSFEPTQQRTNTNGELTFGGIDQSKFTGSITYAPLTTVSPASKFFGINQSIRYGTSTPILSSTAGIVDTGTTLTLISTDALTRYMAATGAVSDARTGLLRLTNAQFANLQSLFFNINGVNFELTPNAQIWPRALNTAIGGDKKSVYLIVNSIGTSTGKGLDFINGMTFLERFYSVYDTTNKRVGFATTLFTNSNSN